MAIRASITPLKAVRTRGDAEGVSIPCSRNPALALIFVRTMCNWRLFEPVELIHGAEHGKIHDKVIGILGRLGQI